MTDRHSGYVIALDRNIREDDAEPILTAIRMIRGIVDVRPIVAGNPDIAIAEMRVRQEIKTRVWEALRDD